MLCRNKRATLPSPIYMDEIFNTNEQSREHQMRYLKYSFHIGIILTVTLMNYANASSIEQGKSKAQLCAGCHGIDGISVGPEFPNLAGQKE
jgi:cytochrome c553